jgi:hypothetical protein
MEQLEKLSKKSGKNKEEEGKMKRDAVGIVLPCKMLRGIASKL